MSIVAQPSTTHRIRVHGNNLYLHVIRSECGKIERISVSGSKHYGEFVSIEAFIMAVNKLLDNRQAMNDVVSACIGVRSGTPVWDDGECNLSAIDGVAKCIKRELGLYSTKEEQ